MANELLAANSDVVFDVTLTDPDDAAWDLTGATVTLMLRKGDGTESEHAASILVAASGTAECELDADDMALDFDGRAWADDAAGRWKRKWRVQQSGNDFRTLWIPFTVEP